MSRLVGSNITRAKKHNRQAILFSLLQDGALSRVELAELLNLTSTTITNLTGELLDQGLIAVADNAQAKPQIGAGRPRTLLTLQADAQYSVGVQIGIGYLRSGLVNLCGELVNSAETRFSLEDSAESVLDTICTEIEQLVQASAIPLSKIVGVGIGASGLVDVERGVNVTAPTFGWRDVPMRAHVAKRLNLPVMIDNNVRAMALGEAFFGAGRNVDLLAFIFGRIGVGAGLVVNGQIFRGMGAGAGEIGHTIVMPQMGELCRCGQRGCLETIVTEPVLIRQIQSQPHLAKLIDLSDLQDYDGIFAQILALATDGNEQLTHMLDHVAHYVGIALVNLVNTLNPEQIILGGMYAQGADYFLPRISDIVRKRSFGGLGEGVEIVAGSFGRNAGSIGAAGLALDAYFYNAA